MYLGCLLFSIKFLQKSLLSFSPFLLSPHVFSALTSPFSKRPTGSQYVRPQAKNIHLAKTLKSHSDQQRKGW